MHASISKLNPNRMHLAVPLQLAALLRAEGKVPDDIQTLALRSLAVQVGGAVGRTGRLQYGGGWGRE